MSEIYNQEIVMDAVTVPEPISPVKDFLAKSQKLLIAGKRVDAASGETFEVLDPSTNTVLLMFPKEGRKISIAPSKRHERPSKMGRGEN
jgi:hypothetical protein